MEAPLGGPDYDVAPAASCPGVELSNGHLRAAWPDPLGDEGRVGVGLEDPCGGGPELAGKRDGLLVHLGGHRSLIGHVAPFLRSSSSSSRSYLASRRRRCASTQSAVRSRDAGSRCTGRVCPSFRRETTLAASSTLMCFDTACSEMGNRPASSFTVASPP